MNVSTHERDIFVWRWTRERKARRTRFVIFAALGTLSGALLGLIFDPAEPGDVSTLFFAILMLTNMAFPTLRFAIERYAPQWITVVDVWPLALMGALVCIIGSGMSVSQPILIAAYSALGAVVGVATAIRTFQRNETKYGAYLAIDPRIPERRPMPTPQDLRGFGVLLLLIIAAFGPVMVLALLQPR